MNAPVYLFTGFLEAGKTQFIQETLEDKNFVNDEKTLLILCEEGEGEYDTSKFASDTISIVTVENQEDLTTDFLETIQAKTRSTRVIIEYNGMWELDTLYRELPVDWEVYQEIMVANSEQFESQFNNIRQLTMDKLQSCELLVCNRFDNNIDKVAMHRSVRMVNRRAQIIYEHTDGSVSYDDIKDEMPFDINADIIEVKDEDFGIWYLDALDEPEKYDGKKIKIKAYTCLSKDVPRDSFIAGRFAMTCCADDIAFVGFITQYDKVKSLEEREWVEITATMKAIEHDLYEGAGLLLKVETLEKADAPKEELVYFVQ